jgi:acetyltransferase-like isoleucine patch superfamily enzyme
MAHLRKRIKEGGTPLYRGLRAVFYFLRGFSIPAPRIIWLPIWRGVRLAQIVFFWIKRVFWVTPIFKAHCTRVGKGFAAGSFLPFVQGHGRIFLGDNVRIHGKVNFFFGSIRDELPEVHIGNGSHIGHNVVFDVADRMEIGENCLIASGVTIQDCGGHPLDPERRAAGLPPTEKEIRPVKIGNRVWIGTRVYIVPGARIGDDCVISAKTTVGRRIPERHLVYSAPAKLVKIRSMAGMVD